MRSLEGVSRMDTLRVGDFSLEDVEEALNAKVGEAGLTFKVLNATKGNEGALGIYMELGMEKEEETVWAWKVLGGSIVYEVIETPEEEDDETED